MTFTVRPYDASCARDLDAMTALIQEAWHPERRPGTSFHIGDLYWRLREPSYEDALWLWEDAAGDLVGFAEYQVYQKDAVLAVQVHPRQLGGGLSGQILDWALDQAASRQSPGSITAFAETDTLFRTLLEARGFGRQDNFHSVHACRIENFPMGQPFLPDGYTVRHLAGPKEVERRVVGHQAGWQSTRMTVAKYRRLMQIPGYRRDLDFVVVAPDGSFAATCNVWLDARDHVGLFEPISTHASHRRLGLGRALIAHGLRQLQTMGAEWAYVSTDSGNLAAQGLYESCGLAVVRRDYAYTLPSVPTRT